MNTLENNNKFLTKINTNVTLTQFLSKPYFLSKINIYDMLN